jgi:hypothetical protein
MLTEVFLEFVGAMIPVALLILIVFMFRDELNIKKDDVF